MRTAIVGVAFYFHVRMCPNFLISVIFSLAVIMAGQSVKASAEMLKNAVTANPTAKHTATVGKTTLESMRKAVIEKSFYKLLSHLQVIFLHGLGDTGYDVLNMILNTGRQLEA